MCKKSISKNAAKILVKVSVLLLGLVLSSVVSAAEPGLVGWWKFDGDFLDSSGLNNHGTRGGNPTFIPGRIGSGALNLDGNDYVVIDRVVNDIKSTNLSLSIWVKTTQTTQGDLFALNDDVGGHPLEFYVSGGYPGRYDEGDVTYTTAPRVADGQWHMMTFVRNGNKGYIYVDGVQAATYISSFSLASVTRWSIGQEWDGGTPSNFYIGMVDDARIYSRSLTAEEVRQILVIPSGVVTATNPSPAHEATNVPRDVTLSWMPGDTAATHDVYFGTSSPPLFIGNQAEASYEPGPLELATTYYWQIDEVEADGTTKHTGDIWSFTTEQVTGIKKGPYLIYPGDNTQMTVLWQLRMTTDCTLEWGTDPNYGNSVTSSEYGRDHQHRCTITSLTPGAKYYYRLQVGDGCLTGSFLAAPPADAENVKFLAYGDTRSNPNMHDAVNAQMIATYTAEPEYQTFAMLTGDWVAGGDNESDWTVQFFDRSWSNTMELQANLPINGCIGNHEQSGIVFEKYWPYPYESGGRYWSFDYGPAHIVVLELKSEHEGLGNAQRAWLEADLAASTKEWKFLQFHAPVYSAGTHSNNTIEQAYIQSLCEVYGVDAVFCGHNHYYSRAMVNGVAHITTGGGGAPLYQPKAGHPNIVAYNQSHHFCKVDIQGRQLTFKAVRLDGTVIDTFTMSHFVGPISFRTEDFETGDFSKFTWKHYGAASWTIDSAVKNSGNYSAQAGSISDDEYSTLEITLNCASGDITFYRKVSSESGFDYLEFYIDGGRKDGWSGEVDWAIVSFPVAAGTRTFEWIYSKDNSTSVGYDTAWIDDIVFPIP